MANGKKKTEPGTETACANPSPFGGGTPIGVGNPDGEMDSGINLDFSGVEDKDFTVPEGFWPAMVLSVKTVPTRKGDKQLEFTFQITERGNNYGKTCKSWIVLLPQCMWKVQQFLKALGVATTGKINLDPKELAGKACRIKVKYDAARDRSDINKLMVADEDDKELALNAWNELNGIPS